MSKPNTKWLPAEGDEGVSLRVVLAQWLAIRANAENAGRLAEWAHADERVRKIEIALDWEDEHE